MGLGKKTGSTRINRYEQQASALGLNSLDAVAKALDVPAAYLLAETPQMADAILVIAETPEMADAILAIAQVDPARQVDIANLLKALGSDPALLTKLLALASNTADPSPAQ